MLRTQPISGGLLELKEKIHSFAVEEGLSFYDVIFEECDYDTISILASQGGFPTRYPHWRFGMDYDQMSKGYRYGMQRIYEMVINTDPCYAYLLRSNPLVDQKIVMAHVYGHADFFRNNAYFSSSNKNMMDVMANHGTKIRRYMNRFGQDRVEEFVDKVLSLETLLDIDELFVGQNQREKVENTKELNIEDEVSPALRSFIKTKKRDEKNNLKNVTTKKTEKLIDYAELPTKDVMKFLMDHAPLEEWEADIVGILREEAYYFLPQRMTKIMNEGWASYWHSHIMTKRALDSSEIIDFADHHSGVMAMSRQQLNPYKIGIELIRDIEERWNKGMFGKDFNDCTDMREKALWDTNAMLGRKKMFEVRKTHNDITFIDEFFTEEFCERYQLFTYKHNPRTGRNEIESKDFEQVKIKLLSSLTNYGHPLIRIESANYKNRSELLLVHKYQGVTLDEAKAMDTIKNIQSLWKRPVNLSTIYNDKELIISFDGKEFKRSGTDL